MFGKMPRYETKYIWHMQKITSMIKQTRVKFLQRPRMRTSTKLVMVFGFFSFVSIVCLVIFFLNVSDHRKVMGVEIMPAPVVVNGKQEVLEEKLLSDFEVKELDRQSYTMANDTVVLFKKMK
jgi:hypothetical protein